MEPIQYQDSFFNKVLMDKVQKTKIFVFLNDCLQDLYVPSSNWQKPGENSLIEDDNGIEMFINFLSSNAKALTYVLNQLNKSINWMNKKGETEITNDSGETIELKQLDFMKNHTHFLDGLEQELNRYLNLICIFKEQLFLPGSIGYDFISDSLKKMVQHDIKNNNLFVKNLSLFFPHTTDIVAQKHDGDVQDDDRIKVEFNYRNQKISVIVRSADKIEQEGEYYKIWCNFNPMGYSTENYYAFILPTHRIYLFENDKTKIRNLSGNSLLDRTGDHRLSFLFHRDILLDDKKVW